MVCRGILRRQHLTQASAPLQVPGHFLICAYLRVLSASRHGRKVPARFHYMAVEDSTRTTSGGTSKAHMTPSRAALRLDRTSWRKGRRRGEEVRSTSACTLPLGILGRLSLPCAALGAALVAAEDIDGGGSSNEILLCDAQSIGNALNRFIADGPLANQRAFLRHDHEAHAILPILLILKFRAQNPITLSRSPYSRSKRRWRERTGQARL